MEEAEKSANSAEMPVDPDIIDLPRRTIGTPQALAGFIFLLGLVMLEGIFPAWDATCEALESKKERDNYYSNLPDNPEVDDIFLQMQLKKREIYYSRGVSELQWRLRFGYISMICFTLGALGLIFGAISLAVSIGTGRKWTWINVILLPVALGSALLFLYFSQEVYDEDALFIFGVLGITSVPLAIILRRMVEWVAPVRDASLKGRDRLRKVYLSRACVATVIISSFIRIPIWLGIADEIDNLIYFSIVHFEYWAVFIFFLGVVVFLCVLFSLRRWRLTILIILIALGLIDLYYVGLIFYDFIRFAFEYSGNMLEILYVIPPVLIFFYPLVALAVMLVRPLGRALFERPAIK